MDCVLGGFSITSTDNSTRTCRRQRTCLPQQLHPRPDRASAELITKSQPVLVAASQPLLISLSVGPKVIPRMICSETSDTSPCCRGPVAWLRYGSVAAGRFPPWTYTDVSASPWFPLWALISLTWLSPFQLFFLFFSFFLLPSATEDARRARCSGWIGTAARPLAEKSI